MIPLRSVVQFRRRRKRSCVWNPAGMEECGVASAGGLLLGPHWSNCLLTLYFITIFTWYLRSDQYWTLLFYSAELNLTGWILTGPLKIGKKAELGSLMTLNQIILWHSMRLERIVCGNMWLGIEQNEEEWKGRKREASEQRGRNLFRHSGEPRHQDTWAGTWSLCPACLIQREKSHNKRKLSHQTLIRKHPHISYKFGLCFLQSKFTISNLKMGEKKNKGFCL